MIIEETTSKDMEGLHYTFESLGSAQFSKELQEKLTQWGIIQNLQIERFRFNKVFSDFSARDFIKELISSDAFKSTQVSGKVGNSQVPLDVTFGKLKCTELNLNFLDKLEENGSQL